MRASNSSHREEKVEVVCWLVCDDRPHRRRRHLEPFRPHLTATVAFSQSI